MVASIEPSCIGVDENLVVLVALRSMRPSRCSIWSAATHIEMVHRLQPCCTLTPVPIVSDEPITPDASGPEIGEQPLLVRERL